MNIENTLTEKIPKVWLKFVIASVVGVLFNTIYTLVDGIFVGQGVGEVGLASVNIAWPAVTFILGLGALLGVGSGTLIAIHLGAQNKLLAERVFSVAVKWSVIIGVVVSIVGLIAMEPLVHMLGANAETFMYTKDYSTIIYCLAIPYILSTTLNPIIRAEGNPKLAMIIVCTGALCNIILDWLFVIVLGWGVKGAALATGVGIIVSTVWSLSYFMRKKSYLQFLAVKGKESLHVLKTIAQTGFVGFAMQISIGIVLLVQNNIIYVYGNTLDIAIFCVAGYIISLYTQVASGISQGMQPLIGYHYGAGLKKRMHQILQLTIVVCMLLGVVSYVILVVGGKYIIGAFGLGTEVMGLAYPRILIYCFGLPSIGIVFTMGAYYQAIAKNVAANVLTITRACILQILFSIVLPPFIGVEGVFYAQPLADIVALLVLGLVVAIHWIQEQRSVRREIDVQGAKE